MKSFALAFALLVACNASALPPLPHFHVEQAIRDGQPRLVTDAIASAVEDASQAIIDAGLDPVVVEHSALDYALPVPSIFNIRAHLKNLLFQGASNIVINQLNLSIITFRLTFNIGLPQILLNVVDSEIDANLFGTNLNGRFSGRIAINNIVTTGNVRLKVGIISGISIRDIALTFKLGGIDSQVYLSVLNQDVSEIVNTALEKTVPNTLTEYEPEINQLITIVGKDIIESLL